MNVGGNSSDEGQYEPDKTMKLDLPTQLYSIHTYIHTNTTVFYYKTRAVLLHVSISPYNAFVTDDVTICEIDFFMEFSVLRSSSFYTTCILCLQIDIDLFWIVECIWCI